MQERGLVLSLVREALDAAGAGEALEEALSVAGATSLPRQPDALATFLDGPLLDALVGRVHPATARAIVDELKERARRTDGASSSPEPAATVPPPPPGGSDPYEALATGAVHTRATPAWGLRRNDAGAPPVWLLVTSDAALIDHAKRSAPKDTDVVEVSSMAVLKGGLARSPGASCVVIDAQSPSIAVDRAIAALVDDGSSARVLLWRMDDGARAQLLASVPAARTWLSCEAEVTAPEIVQLLGA